GHGDEQVIDQVGAFRYKLAWILVLCGDQHLGGLLADLFQDLVDALFKKVRRVRSGHRIVLPPKDHAVELVHQVGPRPMPCAGLGRGVAASHYVVKARPLAGVTRPRSGLFHFNQERITVAVGDHPPHPLHVARRLALLPQLPPAAAVKPRDSRLERPLERLTIHVSDHEHLAGAAHLDHGGHKALFIKPDALEPFRRPGLLCNGLLRDGFLWNGLFCRRLLRHKITSRQKPTAAWPAAGKPPGASRLRRKRRAANRPSYIRTGMPWARRYALASETLYSPK